MIFNLLLNLNHGLGTLLQQLLNNDYLYNLPENKFMFIHIRLSVVAKP